MDALSSETTVSGRTDEGEEDSSFFDVDKSCEVKTTFWLKSR